MGRREVWEKLKPLARRMRQEPTEAELALWKILRAAQLEKLKFRRQHSIGRFIVDFYCSRARLVIEVDGAIHKIQAEQDGERQAFLESRGLRILRLSNAEILNGAPQVIERILSTLSMRSSPSPDAGEGAGGEA